MVHIIFSPRRTRSIAKNMMHYQALTFQIKLTNFSYSKNTLTMSPCFSLPSQHNKEEESISFFLSSMRKYSAGTIYTPATDTQFIQCRHRRFLVTRKDPRRMPARHWR